MEFRLKFYIKLLIAVGIVFSTFCKKKEDKWKIPTSVKFKMDINRATTLGNNLSFNGGNIVVGEFRFDGKRDQGGDVGFTKTYSGLNIPFTPNNTVSEWNFDIPQGSYSEIKITYNTFGNSGDIQIVVTGNYTNTINSAIYPVIFQIEQNESYSIISNTPSGSSQIVLDKNTEAIASLEMDPVYWFQVVTTTMLDNAILTVMGGNSTILINNVTNSNIYDAVKDRIDDNVTNATFN